MNNDIGLLPSCWGGPGWSFLHSIAFAYNPVNFKDYYTFFMTLGSVLPCKECKEHYYQHLDKEELIRELDECLE